MPGSNDNAPLTWQSVFPDLATIDAPEVVEALQAARVVTLDAGTYVFHSGSPCEAYLLVLSGDVRVQVITDAGRSAVLYHVRDGGSCVLTTSCLLGDTRYPAEAIVEVPTTAMAMSKAYFNSALNNSATMRRFVFANLGQRFAEVIARMEQIAFGSIDRRLARALTLLDRHAGITITHEELAAETGTAREVVSRHLKQFETRGWLRLGRGRIEVLDAAALLRLADLQG